jgi:hypothetical protein
VNNPLKRKKILLASVLKPVDDTRMFEKLGRSLNEAGNRPKKQILYTFSSTKNLLESAFKD